MSVDEAGYRETERLFGLCGKQGGQGESREEADETVHGI